MSLKETGGYVVLGMLEIGDVQCRCGTCAWRGMKSALAAVNACELTPGDASPAGRCPKCLGLAYPDRLVDRQMGYAELTHETLAKLVELQDKMAAGKSVRASEMGELLAEAKALLSAVKGRKVRQTKRQADGATEGAVDVAGARESQER